MGPPIWSARSICIVLVRAMVQDREQILYPMISDSELVRCSSECVPEEKANAAPSGSSLGA